jgi:twitching motility protein PilT
MPTITLKELLSSMSDGGIVDAHFHVGSPPMGRINGELVILYPKTLTDEDVTAFIETILGTHQPKELEVLGHCVVMYSTDDFGRFRCGISIGQGKPDLVMRSVQTTIPSFEDLGLPVEVMKTFASKDRGLLLVAGGADSGRTTTVAALVHHIVSTRACLIITIEKPTEFLHLRHSGVVVQRTVGVDSPDFLSAVQFSQYQDADVVVIGEISDSNTWEAVLNAADSKLVIGILPTRDSIQSLEALFQTFVPEKREFVRTRVSEALVGIVSQRLLPRADGVGQVLAHEILIGTSLVRHVIRGEFNLSEVRDALREGDLFGMHTLSQSVVGLYFDGIISEEVKKAAIGHDVDFPPHVVRTRKNVFVDNEVGLNQD